MGEFDLIARYFTRPVKRAALGVGDDCALLAPTPGMQLAVSSDMLVEGPALPVDRRPRAPGPQGAGGEPQRPGPRAARSRWPSRSPWRCRRRTMPGWPASRAVCSRSRTNTNANSSAATPRAGRSTSASRCSAKYPGAPRCCVRVRRLVTTSGSAARWATHGWRWRRFAARCRCRHPSLNWRAFAWKCPRHAWHSGLALRGIATAAIDVSDGLLGDLGHILSASQVGARIDADAAVDLIAVRRLPAQAASRGLTSDQLRTCALSGGDDYELAFTAPASAREAVEAGRPRQPHARRAPGHRRADEGVAHRGRQRRGAGPALRQLRSLRLIGRAARQKSRPQSKCAKHARIRPPVARAPPFS